MKVGTAVQVAKGEAWAPVQAAGTERGGGSWAWLWSEGIEGRSIIWWATFNHSKALERKLRFPGKERILPQDCSLENLPEFSAALQTLDLPTPMVT